MYRTFEVSNFRGIEHLRFDDLARVNLFTGLNDAGKTTALEALFLHASGPLAGGTALQVLRGARGQDLAISMTDGDGNPWDSLFHNLDRTTPVVLKATTAAGDYSLTILDGGLTTSHALPTSVGTGENRPAVSSSIKLVTQQGNDAPIEYLQSLAVEARRGGPASPQEISIDLRLDPPAAAPFILGSFVKGPVGPNLADGYSKLRQRRGAVDLVDALRGIDDRIVDLEVLVSEGRPRLHVDLGEGVLLPIELLGDGPVSVARYLVSLVAAKGGILLIDEIGNDLHHTLLPHLWRTLHRAAERLDVQIFATTHSDECLRAVQEVLSRRPNELRIHRLRRRPADQGTTVASYGDQKLAAALEMNAELR